MALRSEPMLAYLARKKRDEVLNSFRDDARLPILRSVGWHQDIHALVKEIERKNPKTMTADQHHLINELRILLLLQVAAKGNALTVRQAGEIRRFAASGLASAMKGHLAIAARRFELDRRNHALNERAAELSSDLSASGVAEIINKKSERMKFARRGLLPPPSIQAIRKIIAQTIKLKRAAKPSHKTP